MTALQLEDLAGLHVLDGRGEFILDKDEDAYRYDNCTAWLLRLDDIIYLFQEDPSDGYRSSLKEVRVVQRSDIPSGGFVEFAPIVVMCRMQTKPGPWRTEDHRLYGVHEGTGRVIFEVGTENIGDYYPSFIARWDLGGYEPDWLPDEEPSQ